MYICTGTVSWTKLFIVLCFEFNLVSSYNYPNTIYQHCKSVCYSYQASPYTNKQFIKPSYKQPLPAGFFYPTPTPLTWSGYLSRGRRCRAIQGTACGCLPFASAFLALGLGREGVGEGGGNRGVWVDSGWSHMVAVGGARAVNWGWAATALTQQVWKEVTNFILGKNAWS